jgi:Arc/MetJ-type ribon-helix-helix transcriptional regulator
MATLNVNIPEPMKQFVDREVGSGRFTDASAYVQLLIAEAMETKEVGFSEEEKERIDQRLLESLDSFDRGDYAPIRPGEFEDLAKRMVEQHQGKQAS